jgi:hypothetical protein
VDPNPYRSQTSPPDGQHLLNPKEDPRERRNLAGTALEMRAINRNRAALEEIEAPADQLMRIGLG